MWLPGQNISKDVASFFVAALNNDEVKAELSKHIRVEMDNQRIKDGNYRGQVQSYDSLTSGNVNTQARMAASGYTVYGRTLINSNFNSSNVNVYKKLKNKIRYGKNPGMGYNNRGEYTLY